MANTVPLPPLSPPGFSVHLIRAGEDGGEPFVRVADPQPGERRYEALLKSETGAVVARLLLQLPAEEPQPLLDEEGEVAGPVTEARWGAARRDLEALAASPRHFPGLILPAGGETPAMPALLPPAFFCPVPGAIFPIPCPGCLGPLATCRDDALLAQARLPLYSVSSRRFLHCPGCHAAGEATPYFSLEESVPEELRARGVGGLADLRQQLAAALDGRPPAAGGEHLPCASCPEAGACLGAGGGPEPGAAPAPRWVPFNPHDTPFLLTRPHHVSFEGLLDRLGGRPTGGDRSPDLGLLFSPAGSGVDAVEVLALKLAAFRQLVRAVREYYRILDLPHLDLHPAQVGVEEGAPGEELPRLWSFQVKLMGTSSARLLRLDDAVEILRPPPHLQLPYSSPRVRASYLVGRRRGELVLERLEPAGDGWRIVGDLFDPDGIYPEPAPGDWIVLTWPAGTLADGERVTAARLAPAESAGSGRPHRLSTAPVALAAATVRRLEGARGLRIPRIAYRVYPRLGVGDDLYSLGALLLRAVLVNDRQDLGIVEQLAASPEADLEQLRRRHGDALASANVFYQENDRLPGRPNAIPDELWRETLGVALRLLRPESLAEAGGDDPQARLHELWLTVGSLLRRLQLILFYRQPVHLEIRSLISELLAEEPEGGA